MTNTWSVVVYSTITGIISNSYMGIGTDYIAPELKEDEALYENSLDLGMYPEERGYIDLEVGAYTLYNEAQLESKNKYGIIGFWDVTTKMWRITDEEVFTKAKESKREEIEKSFSSGLKLMEDLPEINLNCDQASINNILVKLQEVTVKERLGMSYTEEEFWRMKDNTVVRFSSYTEEIEWIEGKLALISEQKTLVHVWYWNALSLLDASKNQEDLDTILMHKEDALA